METPKANREGIVEGLDRDPFWYKTGVIYELHVRAFCDSDGNGVGDFRGLISKLDYLKDLGVTALWLLPFYPSPLRDDGYDIADYYNVHPKYGTLDEFKEFLHEAHRRGLRVITELVLNHTSDQHPWFQRARRAKPGERWRDFYVWSDTPDKYRDTRIIFADVEVSNWTWDHVAGAYFWHRFFSHQPDLNYDNPEVFEEMIRALDFWLDLGVDGLRLDAVPYLYEREGTSCENLPETHAALKKLRAHIEAKYQDRMLLAEANQWPEDAAAYFGQGQGDECHMAFHFPLMPRLFMALRMEDRAPIVDILEQMPAVPETCQWALFLRNHDELTLEMVTDEERDYLYRTYAHVHQARLNLGIRRRLAPLLGNDRRRIELLNALLFSLPGTPVLYYGDEIGMGENIYLGDRNGVRTPMQWSSDKNAGFSRSNPQALYLPIIYDPEYHYEAVNVEAQLGNPHSLLWWMRRLLALRKKWRAFGEGQCEFLPAENRRILSYVLRDEHETLLVVANLSRFVQPVELDLSAFKQWVPVELFGRTEFPTITERKYPLTLGPHAFCWFSLEARLESGSPASGLAVPVLGSAGKWSAMLSGPGRAALEALLPAYLRSQAWFSGKTRGVRQFILQDIVPLVLGSEEAGCLALVLAEYMQGEPELYSLTLTFAFEQEADRLREASPELVIAEVDAPGFPKGILYEGLGSPNFCQALLDMLIQGRASDGFRGRLEGSGTTELTRLLANVAPSTASARWVDHGRATVLYGDTLALRWFRRLEAGVHADLDMGRFLAARAFPNVSRLAGALEYRGHNGDCLSVAMAYGGAHDAREAWDGALDALGRYYDRVKILHAKGQAPPEFNGDVGAWFRQEMTTSIQELIGTYLESARLLGRITGQLHLTLASATDDAAWTPEPFTPHYARGLYQSMRNLATQNLRGLRRRLDTLPPEVRRLAEKVVGLETAIINQYRPLFEYRLFTQRIRIHGDYHLGRLLWTGKDFLIADFEGDPQMTLNERRIKRSPLRDVAGMVRSFHHAAYAGLRDHINRGSLLPENSAAFEPWTDFWTFAVSAAFLQSYFQALGGSEIVPRASDQIQLMLRAFLLHKAIGELTRDQARRPDELRVSLLGILQYLERVD